MARNSGSLISRTSKAGSTTTSKPASNGLSLAEERRFATLQRRLENEGYKFGFGPDSIPLTEKLLDDLVSVRGTFQTLQDQFQELRTSELRLQRQVQPLQRELSRVVRENNQLHLELIQRGEDLENNARRHNLQEKKLSADVTDKTFVIHQQFHQIRELERDLSAHKERIERLLDKNFTCTAGPTGDLMPKGQDLHISKALNRPEIDGRKPHIHQEILDLESETSNQITAMKKQLESFAGVRQELEMEISSLQKAVENRDLEIQRLGKLLETNINSQGEEMAQELEEKADIIRRLNGQIDFLTAQIVDSDSHGQDCKNLNISRNTEIEELRSRQTELLRLLNAADSEKKRLQECLAKHTLAQDPAEKEHLLNEIAALKDREKELVASLAASQEEVQRLRAALTSSTHDTVNQRSAERQMLTYEKQIASMEEALSKSRQLAASYLEQARQEAAQADEARAEAERLRSRLFPENAEMQGITGRSSTESEILSDLQQKCDQLAEDNAALVSSLEERQQRCDSLREEANEMRRLRDGLAAVVLDFENQLIMVQENIRDLSCEREAKDKKIESLSESLRTAEEEIRRQRNNPSNAGPIEISEDSDFKQGARQGRDSASNSFRQGQTEEAHALSEKLQASNASVSMLQVRLETALGDLRACSSKEQVAAKQLQEAQAKCAEKESAIRQLQTLMAHLDETRGDVASRLQGYMEENTNLKERLRTMEVEVQSLQSELKRRDDDVDRARSAISTVDGERDSLLLQLEDRAERIHELEALRTDLEQKQSHSLANFMTAQQQVDLLRQALGERDAQVRELQEQLEAESRRRSAVEGQLALRLEEARNLTSDLSIMTRENQVVNTELATLVSQREALKRDLDETFERLAVAEQLVQGREKERDDVLMSYRALNEEKVRAEASLDRCSSECHQLRAQVYAREEELLRLREVAEALEQEQYRSMLDLQTGQRHMDGLSEKVVELQAQLRLAGADTVAMKQELGSCRNVAALLERQKQELLREAALLRDEIVALRGKLEQRDVERAAQTEKLDLERRRTQELEGVLQALRAREHASQEAERARANENVSLQDQLRKARDEVERQGQELRAVRARMEDLDYESQRRQRACTAENAERDGLQAEAAQMRARLRELQEVAERQGVALEAKQEEMTQLRLRLSRMQAEAERSERHVLELETCLRRHDDAARGLEATARQQQLGTAQLAAEKDELRGALRKAEEQLERAQLQLKAAKEAEQAQQARAARAASEAEDLRGETALLRARLEEAQAAAARFREESGSLSRLVERLDAEMRDLQAKYASLQERHRSMSHPPAAAAAAGQPPGRTVAAAAGGERGPGAARGT